nr:zinc finger protein 2-like [Onthophagus taurus]
MATVGKEEPISIVKLVDYTISICRVCSLSTECQNIFSMKYCDLTFADLFYYSTRIELAPEDNPYHVCLMCVGKLLNAYEFIIQCEKAWYAQKLTRLSAQLATNNKQFKAIAPKPLTDVTVYVDVPKEFVENAGNQQEVIVFTDDDGVIKGNQIFSVIEDESGNMSTKGLNSKIKSLPIKKQTLIKILAKEGEDVEQENNDKDDIFEDILQELTEAEANSNLNDNEKDDETEIESTTEIGEELDIKPPYKCVKCNKVFRQIHYLNKHILDHLNFKKCCNICNKEFSNQKALSLHLHTHRSNRQMVCEHCGKTISRHSFKSHFERYHSEEAKEFSEKKSCRICSIPVTTHQELTAHMQAFHSQNDHLCNICGKTFLGLARLKKHMLIHDERRRVSCTICNKVFSSRESLKQHVYTHTGVKPYQCHICGKRCTQSQQLKAHIRIHTGDKPYTCKFCGNSFTTSAALKIHVRGRHFNDKPHVCDVCGKCFIQRGPLERHLRLHAMGRKNSYHNRNSWPCSLCNTVFETRREHLAHQCPNIHLAPYECGECGKKFRMKPLLTVHMRIHTGETPFKCQYCPKAFRSKPGLKEHTYMHTGEKRYICDICGKGCVQRQQLISHMRIHTGVRPYKCYDCGSTFTLKGNLTVHMRMHTGETPYKCECGASYYASNALKRHQVRCNLFIYEETVNECEVYTENIDFDNESVSN